MTDVKPDKKPRRPRAEVDREIQAGMPEVVVERVKHFVRENDSNFFIRNIKVPAAAKKFRSESGVDMKLRDLNAVIRVQAKEACSMWMRRLKPRLSMKEASEGYWEKLKSAIEKQMCLLTAEEISADAAERIIRLRIGTNRKLMSGLPKRLRVWE